MQLIPMKNTELASQLETSLETWSRSRDVSRDPFSQVSVSKVSGLVSVSVSKDFGLGVELENSLETLHELFFYEVLQEAAP